MKSIFKWISLICLCFGVFGIFSGLTWLESLIMFLIGCVFAIPSLIMENRQDAKEAIIKKEQDAKEMGEVDETLDKF